MSALSQANEDVVGTKFIASATQFIARDPYVYEDILYGSDLSHSTLLYETNLISPNITRLNIAEALVYTNERDKIMSFIAEFMESIAPLIGLIGTIFWIWMLID